MSAYGWVFDRLGLRDWCDANKADAPMDISELLASTNGSAKDIAWYETPFPSLDNLHRACHAIPKSVDLTSGIETTFLDIKSALKFVLDPITQPLSWLLDGALALLGSMPWWTVIPFFVIATFILCRSVGVTILVALSFVFFALVDLYPYAIQTLAIILVCTMLCVLIGVPVGIAMSKYNVFRRASIPVLDMLQTLPSFVYLIPLIFLFSVTESKLYGIAIILYAIVPVIRLTDLGIRLVDKDVIEAANAFGMTARQKLFKVEIPLALPNIMAGVNQTIMMSLAMVVIASLVSAPGLGTLVLRGIRNLELGVGLMSGFGIVLLAVILDRVSKATLARIDTSHKQ